MRAEIGRCAARLLSGEDPQLRELELALGQDFRRGKDGRQEYVPARVTDAGELVPVELHGSAHLTALLAADGFMVVPPGTATLSAGGKVRFLPLRGLHG